MFEKGRRQYKVVVAIMGSPLGLSVYFLWLCFHIDSFCKNNTLLVPATKDADLPFVLVFDNVLSFVICSKSTSMEVLGR